MADIIGNANGIKLWELMSNTQDKSEAEYFKMLSVAASKYGKVFFVDSVTERNTKENQVTWSMVWDPSKSVWEVSKFHVPRGAVEATDRLLKVCPT